MAKIIADSVKGTLILETVAGEGAPEFARGQPVVYEGELNTDNMIEAMAFIESLPEEEAVEVKDADQEEEVSEND